MIRIGMSALAAGFSLLLLGAAGSASAGDGAIGRPADLWLASTGPASQSGSSAVAGRAVAPDGTAWRTDRPRAAERPIQMAHHVRHCSTCH